LHREEGDHMLTDIKIMSSFERPIVLKDNEQAIDQSIMFGSYYIPSPKQE